MTITTYHFHPELLDLLIQTIPLLVRSKKDVLMFFRGAGVPDTLTNDVSNRLKIEPDKISKYEIARTILMRLNDADSEMLGQRREVIKRVCEFEAYSSCWPSDQLKAKGLVSDIRRHVNAKDSFTRMQLERDAEHKAAKLQHLSNVERIQERHTLLSGIKCELFSLFSRVLKNSTCRAISSR